ncbi:HIT-like protein [Violaceomyces palustris]|uniref:HIT-like protein n=1 Tax=Violaceomyces palustris TaxID=1673888 RepID=A0ACD0NU71_9BASI|nr:HIT-like protein [Violaceomyces palustris]
MSFLSRCFQPTQADRPLLERDRADHDPRLLNDSSTKAPNCIFCNVTPEKFNVVLEDEEFIAFKDRSPASLHHLLVIPRIHIDNVNSLTRKDVALLKGMHAFGERALDLISSEPADGRGKQDGQRRFGFHIPPFRSVEHLHLHSQALPYKSWIRSMKYRVVEPNSDARARGYHKGWTWFVEVGQACDILKDGGRIKVGAC